MKTKTLFMIGIGTILLAGCGKQYTYEFHTGADGKILWRCNRATGEVTIMETNAPATTEFDIHNSTDLTPIIFDKASGQAWRYYRNHDTNGQTTAEGFVRLRYNEQ